MTGAASLFTLKLFSAAVDERAAGSEKPKTAPPRITEAIAARGPELDEAQKAGNDATEAALFSEFLQWRAARVSGVVPNVWPNAAESHHRSWPAVTPTAAATNSQSRSTHLS